MTRPPLFTVNGIILKRRNWGEADKIITVYTREYGKLNLMVKGVRKLTSRRSGHIEPFRTVKLTVRSGKKMDYLSEVVSEPLKIDKLRLNTLGYEYIICEMIDRLVPEQVKNEDIFHLLKGGLYQVAKNRTAGENNIIVEKFANSLLQYLGFLEPTRLLKYEAVISFIEEVIEKHLKSPGIIGRLNKT